MLIMLLVIDPFKQMKHIHNFINYLRKEFMFYTSCWFFSDFFYCCNMKAKIELSSCQPVSD